MTRTRSWSASFTSLLTKSSSENITKKKDNRRDTFISVSDAHTAGLQIDSSPPRSKTTRPTSRPLSMFQPFQPPPVEIEKDTLPELQPIFNFLNIHTQKLYTEGYFLKLADLTPDGKPVNDRSWKECFAQLRGTVLSLWNAAELDAAGQNEEVLPTFINLTDASIKMIDTMPTRSPDIPPLTNVLSISTAGRNRFLLHFNSYHSLTQWAAGIRLCMFEHSKLQEIYTGALIAAKGRTLNAVSQITERTRFKYEDWVRVRFGAGTPWRKYWAVISQPDEKMVKKARAAAKKANKTAYQQNLTFKGDIKFYDDKKKSKKGVPVATITDAFAAYALYPQSKQLIEMSTLIKIEGKVRFHGDQPTENEGYVFVMPDFHAAVSGFETMLRFLFPTWDTFALYGRPGMLAPDKRDIRSLMFAMPRDGTKQCGYLDIADVANVVVAEGNELRLESEWRAKLNAVTEEKLLAIVERPGRPRSSLPPKLQLDTSPTSLPASRQGVPPQHVPQGTSGITHQRSASENAGLTNYRGQPFRSPTEERYLGDEGPPPSTSRRSETSSDGSLFQVNPSARHLQQQTSPLPLEPVPVTPVSSHLPSSRPLHPLPHGSVPSDNLFEGIVPPRLARTPSPSESQRALPGNQYIGTSSLQLNHQALYGDQVEVPPGFELQSSHVLLRGPPPQDDRKYADEQEYQREVPQHHESDNFDAGYHQSRYSWQPATPSDSPPDDTEYRTREYMHPLPSPPIPAKLALKAPGSQPPPLDTRIERKALPGAGPNRGMPNRDAQFEDTPDSLRDFRHLVDEAALARIGPKQQGGVPRSGETDEDTLDRKAMARIQRVLAGEEDSDSDYGDGGEDDEPDYASSVDTREPPPKRDADMPRTGRMKVVGKEPEPEVVIGDVHYRPSSSGKPLADPTNIPKVDFGMTVSHGRSLSTEVKSANRGNTPTADSNGYASRRGDDNRRNSTYGLAGDHTSASHTRAPSRGSGGSESWNRPSPGSRSHSSDGDQQKRRSMAWQPAVVHTAEQNPDRTAAERYVAERAAAAQNQSRSRYLNQRRSTQLLNNAAPTAQRASSTEHVPIRPVSRGPNAAFLPNGLISAPDLSSHLSAREQEFVARKTGSTLLRMDNSKVKPPPHKVGLIGAIDSREREKKQMRESWQRGQLAQGGVTVQQEIARRQEEQARKERSMKMRSTPSPRPLSTTPYDQPGHFAQQSYPQQSYQQQSYPQQTPSMHQMPQPQQEYYAQQLQLQQQQQQMQMQMQMSYGYPNQGPPSQYSGSHQRNNYYGKN